MRKMKKYLLHCHFNGWSYQQRYLTRNVMNELVLIPSASDDIDEPDLTRRLLRDLRDVRLAKARKGMDAIGDTHVQMDNLGAMEINEIRFLSQAVDQLRHLHGEKPDGEDDLDSEKEGRSTMERNISDDEY
jgi:hypothetical protein